ncbi:HPr kinase/phosphorylase [Sphingosinicella sp.]|uniref:HPr kinase/phosphorylase n=1 Tax=Sphingosinicella sp. TaxID=1917971 RepID=UPI00403838A6
MSMASTSSETIHVSTVAIAGKAVLIGGLPGAGKSDLALRLIDRGAVLVSDDYTIVRRTATGLIASAPPTISGQMEVRGLGIVEMPSAVDVPVALFVDLDATPQRLPEPGETRSLCGIAVPVVVLNAHEDSAPIKVELALKRIT